MIVRAARKDSRNEPRAQNENADERSDLARIPELPGINIRFPPLRNRSICNNSSERQLRSSRIYIHIPAPYNPYSAVAARSLARGREKVPEGIFALMLSWKSVR